MPEGVSWPPVLYLWNGDQIRRALRDTQTLFSWSPEKAWSPFGSPKVNLRARKVDSILIELNRIETNKIASHTQGLLLTTSHGLPCGDETHKECCRNYITLALGALRLKRFLDRHAGIEMKLVIRIDRQSNAVENPELFYHYYAKEDSFSPRLYFFLFRIVYAPILLSF